MKKYENKHKKENKEAYNPLLIAEDSGGQKTRGCGAIATKLIANVITGAGAHYVLDSL